MNKNISWASAAVFALGVVSQAYANCDQAYQDAITYDIEAAAANGGAAAVIAPSNGPLAVSSAGQSSEDLLKGSDRLQTAQLLQEAEMGDGPHLREFADEQSKKQGREVTIQELATKIQLANSSNRFCSDEQLMDYMNVRATIEAELGKN